jgi:MSHA biogenesis protein MshI
VFGLLKRSAAAKGRIGIALERDRIAIAVVTRESGQLVLERCDVLPVDPAAGADAVAACIRGAGLPRLPAGVVLRADDYQLVLVEAPDVPPAELRAAIRWRLKDAIDFRVDDAVIDVFDVPAQNRGGHGRMMYAVAARRAAVGRCAAALASVPAFDVVDVPELCLRNIAAQLPDAASGIALLQLDDSTASVILVRGATFYFARQIELRAAQVVRGQGPGGGAALLDADAIVLELQRSLDYYERHFDQPPITHIAISSGGPQARALAAALGQNTGFDVTLLDLNTMLRCAVPLNPEAQSACLLAVGAAMRAERRSP